MREPPAPKPPARENTSPRNFRQVGLVLCGVALLGVSLLMVSLRTSAPPPEAMPKGSPRPGAPPEREPEPPPPAILEGSVRDQATGRPVPRARVYYAGRSLIADELGRFELTPVEGDSRLFVKASGYRQTESTIDLQKPIRLKPIEIRAFYLSASHVADPLRRQSILRLIRTTSANAVVLGVKDVTGRVNIEVDSPLAAEIGATSKAASTDLARQVAVWKSEGIYTIALLTLFKDDLLARSRPDLALLSLKSQRLVEDPDGIAWTNPSLPAVRDYNIAVAKAAAAAGFDEIQFDFARYSAEALSREGGNRAEYERRLETIVNFLGRASDALAPYNVYVGSSVFGSVCTIPDAGVIGQKIEEFAEHLDYVSPMLYPSYFEPGLRHPVPLKHSYQLVYENLVRAANRLNGDFRRLRPWLQNFPDRAAPDVPLKVEVIHGQVKAVVDARVSGWMLWDARNQYHNTSEALQFLNSKSNGDAAKTETVTGGSLISAGGGIDGTPPSAGAAEKLRLVAVLLLGGCCLAVLYGSARAAWLFRTWNRNGAPLPKPVARPRSSGGIWTVRAKWFGGWSQAKPRWH